MFGLDAIEIARIQFAFTISFHIIFPAITIGLSTYIAVLEGLWLKTNKQVYYNLSIFWTRIFAVNFGMGVVSGLVMAFQFGTNWSGFSAFSGSITGPLLTYEVMTAFFLEAGFLGVMLFGWRKVGRKLHFFATAMVAVGTNISMFWILSSNSWMQTPQGFEVIDNQVFPVDWLAIVFNPSFLYRFVHMGIAAFLSTALLVAAVGAWHLLRGHKTAEHKTMFSMALWFIIFIVPIQFLAGDMHGLNTLKYQPTKIAAIEGHWENIGNDPTPLILFGWPDLTAEETKYKLEIPVLGSLILMHSVTKQVPALKDVPIEDRPNVPLVFWSFRIMVGLGGLMAMVGVVGLYRRFKKTIYQGKWWLRFVLLMGPSGLIAILAGWFVTEVGRQPWIIYGLLRTKDAASAHGDLQMSISLLSFIVIYLCVFGAGYFYMMKQMSKGATAITMDNSKSDHEDK